MFGRDPRILLVSLASIATLASVAACSDQVAPAAPYAFNRPEHLGFVCLDPDGSDRREAADDETEPLVLPLRCCALDPTFPAEDSPYAQDCPPRLRNASPTLHALITQSTRGELAAVDLVAGRVIDSDILVPGFTFVDVGGLPAAVVVPTERPRPVAPDADPDAEKPSPQGPPWTYVASAEELHVRAVATCRFRSSGLCGPERVLTADAETLDDIKAAQALLKVPLPSAPRDMIFALDALWVTLPDVGLIARIDLSAEWAEPFALTADKKAPLKPTFFALKSVSDGDPGEPMSEAEIYQASCGLGYDITPGLEYLKLPRAPLVTATGGPRPTRLRLDELANGADEPVLLVADQNQPVLRAFSIGADKNLVERGALPVGAPVRDFVVTPEVPTLLAEDGFMLGSPLPAPDAPTQRYLYALDDRDGSLFVHRYSYGTGGVSSDPLVMPNARRFSDRLEFGGSGLASGLALDVIDTRSLSEPYCGQVLEEGKDPTRVYTLTDLEKFASDADKALDAAEGAEAIAAAEIEKDEADIRLGIAEEAGPYQLRGVFIALTSTAGQLRIVDVHDLDAPCRAENYCSAKDPTFLVDDDEIPLAVRRHALRLNLTSTLEAALDDEVPLGTNACPEGYRAIIAQAPEMGEPSPDDAKVCMAQEPRRGRGDTWNLTYGGLYAAALQGYLVEEDDGSVVIYGAGADFCARGVEYEGMTGGAEPVATPSDVIAIRGESTVAGCPELDLNEPVLLPIKAAYADRLVLDKSGANAAKVDELLSCYPELLLFDLRVDGQFTVVSSSIGFEHRVTTADDGACVIDPLKDPLLRFRSVAGEPFQNAYVSFKLLAEADDEADLNTVYSFQIATSSGNVELPVFDSSQGRTDSLPVTVKFFPYRNEVFVVDTASQGMRRYTLSPFLPTSSSFR